jgi:hypothetical protein
MLPTLIDQNWAIVAVLIAFFIGLWAGVSVMMSHRGGGGGSYGGGYGGSSSSSRSH